MDRCAGGSQLTVPDPVDTGAGGVREVTVATTASMFCASVTFDRAASKTDRRRVSLVVAPADPRRHGGEAPDYPAHLLFGTGVEDVEWMGRGTIENDHETASKAVVQRRDGVEIAVPVREMTGVAISPDYEEFDPKRFSFGVETQTGCLPAKPRLFQFPAGGQIVSPLGRCL